MPDRQLTSLLVAGLIACAPINVAFAQTGSAEECCAVEGEVKFVTQAAFANRFIIGAAEIALERSRDPGVIALAQSIFDRHVELWERLEAASLANTVPPGLMQPEAELLSELADMPTAQFRTAFLRLLAGAHQDLVELLEAYLRSGDDPLLRRYADEALPAVKETLQSLEQLTSGG